MTPKLHASERGKEKGSHTVPQKQGSGYILSLLIARFWKPILNWASAPRLGLPTQHSLGWWNAPCTKPGKDRPCCQSGALIWQEHQTLWQCRLPSAAPAVSGSCAPWLTWRVVSEKWQGKFWHSLWVCKHPWTGGLFQRTRDSALFLASTLRDASTVPDSFFSGSHRKGRRGKGINHDKKNCGGTWRTEFQRQKGRQSKKNHNVIPSLGMAALKGVGWYRGLAFAHTTIFTANGY